MSSGKQAGKTAWIVFLSDRTKTDRRLFSVQWHFVEELIAPTRYQPNLTFLDILMELWMRFLPGSMALSILDAAVKLHAQYKPFTVGCDHPGHLSMWRICATPWGIGARAWKLGPTHWYRFSYKPDGSGIFTKTSWPWIICIRLYHIYFRE